MMTDCETREDILMEVHKFNKHIDGIRKNNGHWEWAIKNCQDELEWFSIHVAPINVEKYVIAASKIGL